MIQIKFTWKDGKIDYGSIHSFIIDKNGIYKIGYLMKMVSSSSNYSSSYVEYLEIKEYLKHYDNEINKFEIFLPDQTITYPEEKK